MDPQDNNNRQQSNPDNDAFPFSETSSLRRGGGSDRSGAHYYERYHINQFYNSVEDEQLYTDEYTNLIHAYNQFVINGNAMFSRMEQTLRSQLERSIVRQSFYYHRFNEIFHARHPNSVNRNVYQVPLTATSQATTATTTPVPVSASAAGVASTGVSQDTNAQQPSRRSRLGDTFGRLISSYLTTELERQHRQRQDAPSSAPATTPAATTTTNPFSLLYTYAQPILFRQTGAGSTGSGGGGPTPEQINRATLNTTYANVAAPVNTTCPISRDEFNDESEITVIRGCHHIFNRSSLREWFVSHSTCPMCRNDIRNYRASGTDTEAETITDNATRDLLTRIIDNSGNFANLMIDNVTNDEFTFSYDLPPIYDRYNDEHIYHNIVNTLMGGGRTSTTNTNTNQNNSGAGDEGVAEDAAEDADADVNIDDGLD